MNGVALAYARPALRTERAPAKINLALRVVGRRADGYHLLDSLVVFASVGDTLDAREADELSLTLTGPFAAGLAAETDNLVLRAARLLAASAGIVPRARVVLDKRLPIASGIGGGSADAAAALRALALLWRLDVPRHEMTGLAVRLGADVPVCLAGQTARMSGIGDVLEPGPRLPEFGLVLLNPGVAVATADVFRARSEPFSGPLDLPGAWPDADAMASGLAAMGNDLEAPALALQPRIAEALAALRAYPACLIARMSGSGATCWALCRDPSAARDAARALRRTGWWVWGGAAHA